MSTVINLNYKNENYTLEYTRQAAQSIESQGFVYGEIGDKANIMVPLLVYGAFMQHHRGIKRATVNEIFDHIVGKQATDDKDGFIQVLLQMYLETVTTLTEDYDGDEGNAATWEVQK